MDTMRKITIFVVFIGVMVLGGALRMWVEGGRRYSFKSELRTSLIFLIVLGAIAAVMIYLNN